MKVTITHKGITQSKALEEHILENLSKVEDYFGYDAECNVVYRQDGRMKVCEVTIIKHGDIFRSEGIHEDAYTAVIDAITNIKDKVRKYKSKIEKLRREKAKSKREHVNVCSKYEINEESHIEVDVSKGILKAGSEGMESLLNEYYCDIKEKEVKIKKMTPQEAIMAMEMLGYDFYIFLNTLTNEIAVVYRRNVDKHGENKYGLINITR